MDGETKGVLFVLKESLVTANVLSPGHRKILRKMIELVDEDPGLLKHLDEWRFLERQFPYLAREPGDRVDALALATRVLRHPEARLPSFFMTKKGGFFLSELLYECLEDPGDTIDFCREAVGKNPQLVNILYDCGFFILLNSVVSNETARLYSLVFAYKQHEERAVLMRRGGDDVMYEIRRKYFDPEVVFRENNGVVLKEPPTMHRTAGKIHRTIFDDLYNTIFFDLLELGMEAGLHVMNYCDWDYLFLCGSVELRELVTGGNYLAVRQYRRMLEHLRRSTNTAIYLNMVEDDDLMACISKLLESKETHVVMECALILYNYYELFGWGLDERQFTEARIRRVVGMLEFSHSSCRCLNACLQMPDTEGLSECLGDCDTRKLLVLLSRIYSKVDRKYFFKPSFLVLMATWSSILSRHRCCEFPFLADFFSDFTGFLRSNPYNFARVVFPFRETKRGARTVSDDTEYGASASIGGLWTREPVSIEELEQESVQDGSDIDVGHRTRYTRVIDSELE